MRHQCISELESLAQGPLTTVPFRVVYPDRLDVSDVQAVHGRGAVGDAAARGRLAVP